MSTKKQTAKLPKQPRANAVKAVKMYASLFEGRIQNVVTCNRTMGCTIPVAVMDTRDTDALVEQGSLAIDALPRRSTKGDCARAVLESIGIIPKLRKAK